MREQALGERVGGRLFNDDPLGRNARLPGVLEPAPGRPCCRCLEAGVGEHDERIAAAELGEPYRTILGHFRHEIAHYYWPIMIERGGGLERWRSLFGDERLDYNDALARHYEIGPPPDWSARHVSAYAAAHPWEDWAETFAHYLHIRDTLQTAAAYGLVVAGPPAADDSSLMAAPAPDAGEGSFDGIVRDWLPLTYALNAINRSMGRDHLYPFTLAPTVIDKLAFIHDRLRPNRDR